jgi:hypothetical protein
MRNIVIYIYLLFISLLVIVFRNDVYSSGGEYNSIDNSCSAVVSIEDHTASFIFPIVTDTKWTWYRDTTNDNSLEYSWTISLADSDSPISNFGAYLFKFPGSTPRNGTLEALIMKTQHSIFGSSGKVEDDLKVNAKVEGDAVTIYIDDIDTYNVLFHSRPPYARFYIRLPDRESVSCDANIDYY